MKTDQVEQEKQKRNRREMEDARLRLRNERFVRKLKEEMKQNNKKTR